jgi:exodeoxyribonuclease VII large subunit
MHLTRDFFEIKEMRGMAGEENEGSLVHAGDNIAPPLKVSELVAILKADVEQKHRFVRVVGEISSFKQWRSGHCYFDIKDEQALIPAVMFRPHFLKVPFAVADGQSALFSGKVSIYQANARLQMLVETMEPLGQGALALAFEQLKDKLRAEGLFNSEHKKPIKMFNQCVGIITSSHGAVLRDMVRILKTRMPKTDILFFSVHVQGAGASEEIANAISFLDQTSACDVIIVGRGGGSLEDLWAFNEENVARAIFRAKTPIVSAVGHETDTTISDFVADMRAATPTHAATIAVPKLSELVVWLSSAQQTLKLRQQEAIGKSLLRIAQEKRRLIDPRVLLFRHWQRIDEIGKQLNDALLKRIRTKAVSLEILSKRLQLLSPLRQLHLKKDAFFDAKTRMFRINPLGVIEKSFHTVFERKNQLDQTMSFRIRHERQRFERLVAKLDVLSPLKVLARGFCLIEDENHRILHKARQFDRGQKVTIRLEDAAVGAVITGVKHEHD